MIDLQEWAEQYLLVCKYQKGLDTKSIKAYRIDISQFIEFAELKKGELTRIIMTKFISELHKKYKPRTVRRKVSSIKAFCSYLEYEELIAENPFTKLQLKLNAPQILPRTIPFSVIKAILCTAYCHGHSRELSEQQKRTSMRDIAVLELLFATGIRVSELCALKHRDVNIIEGEVKIYGKGAKERLVQIGNPEVLKALQEYRCLNLPAIEQTGMFFVNRLEKPLSDQSVRNIVAKYARLVDDGLHITPHMFRHSFATYLIEEGVDVSCVQQILGHSSIKTTQIYIHIAAKKQAEILRVYHPRNTMKIHGIA